MAQPFTTGLRPWPVTNPLPISVLSSVKWGWQQSQPYGISVGIGRSMTYVADTCQAAKKWHYYSDTELQCLHSL